VYNVTITFQVGPTILDGDTEEIQIRRFVPESQLTKIQQAAVTLDAKNVTIVKEEPKSR
jgi:hypothetical protein